MGSTIYTKLLEYFATVFLFIYSFKSVHKLLLQIKSYFNKLFFKEDV